jgi:hypothetical protein
MSVTAWISEFSECDLSKQGWTATHVFGRQSSLQLLIFCQLLCVSILKDFWKEPGVTSWLLTSWLQLSDGMKWDERLDRTTWVECSRRGISSRVLPW